MTGFDDEEEGPGRSLFERCRPIARAAATFAPPLVSIAAAIVAGYFSHNAVTTKPPEDMTRLAISILRSDGTPPELRDWAASALKIQTDLPLAR
jgi:hypothetical protein